nr:MAG TPA: zinc finger protein [Caudoviricetes sp.]
MIFNLCPCTIIVWGYFFINFIAECNLCDRIYKREYR